MTDPVAVAVAMPPGVFMSAAEAAGWVENAVNAALRACGLPDGCLALYPSEGALWVHADRHNPSPPNLDQWRAALGMSA